MSIEDKLVVDKLISSKDLKSIISDIERKPELSSFMNKLSENDSLQRFLFLHRIDLFTMENGIPVPYFYYCTLRKRKKSAQTEEPSKALSIVVEKEEMKIDQLQKSFVFFLGLGDEKSAKQFMRDLEDIFFYFLIKFVKSNDALNDLINEKEGFTFTYAKMKEKLKDYREISFDVLKELGDLFKDENEENLALDRHIKRKIEDYISHLFNVISRDLLKWVEAPSKAMPAIILQFHLISSIWVNGILEKSRLSFDEYSEILTDMYSHGLIRNFNTVYWCENCYVDVPFFDISSGRFAPTQINRKKCVKCFKPMSFSTIYALDETLKDALLNRDGIMAVLLGYLLKKEGIEYESQSYSSSYENDFLIRGKNGYILVECKMYRTGSDNTTVESQLDGGVSQLVKHADKLKEEGKEIKKGYFVWNHASENRHNSIEQIRQKYKKDFSKYQIEIVDRSSLTRLVAMIKRNALDKK